MDPWVEQTDAIRGRSYWVNVLTGESTWVKPGAPVTLHSGVVPLEPVLQRPEAPQEEHDWVEKQDPAHNRPYWVNTRSGESVWTQPAVLSLSAVLVQAAHALAPEATEATPTEEPWIEKRDLSHNRSYWVNVLTGESTWVKPGASVIVHSVPIEPAPHRSESPAEHNWVENQDPTHNRPYWVNTRSGESVWIQPAVLLLRRYRLAGYCLGQKGGLATRQGEERKGEAQVRLARISSSRLHIYLLGSVEQA
jgi:hypothetical protein